jgi:hypothetical protein
VDDEEKLPLCQYRFEQKEFLAIPCGFRRHRCVHHRQPTSATTRTKNRGNAERSSASIESRPGFAALLNRIDGNGVRIVLVEDATRFARDLMAQELGIGVLIKLGMRSSRLMA